MKKVKQLLICFSIVQITGCATIFIPSKQKVTINTSQGKSTVYVDNEEIGRGETLVTKVKKDAAKQVVIQTPGYKDVNYVLVQNRKHAAFWPMIVLDLPTLPLIYPILFDVAPKSKFYNFNTVNNLSPVYKYTNKTSDEKYIQLEAIRLSVTDKNKDLRDYFNVAYSPDIMEAFSNAERNTLRVEEKQEAKNMRKKKSNKKLLEEEKGIEFDDTKFSDVVFKTLKKTGYIDTVNKVFQDYNNTIVLEGVIKKASAFHVVGSGNSRYNKAKVNVTWKIKNSFGETLDSITAWSYSGDFVYDVQDKGLKMFADAVDNSYLDLKKKGQFTKYLKSDTISTIKEPALTISMPKKTVQEVSQASIATVVIKRDDGGHGSGFAINNDGYILTNFHVIAGSILNKQAKLTVILSTGEEVPATVVRYNRMRDIALLKVNKSFEYAFSINNNKTYKNLMEVYTIGTPKSIELGQSVSLGLISNERKFSNITLLQLSMAVNHGNSGGPLFEKNGNLQGVVSSKLVGYATEGVGFAIPSYLIPTYLNLNLN